MEVLSDKVVKYTNKEKTTPNITYNHPYVSGNEKRN